MVERLRGLLASIRTRLLATIVVALAVSIGGTALGTRIVLLERVDERIAGQLVQEAEELRVFADTGLDPRTGTPFGSDAARLLTVYLERSVPTEGEVLVTYLEGEPFRRTAQRVPYRVDTDPELTRLWGGTTTTRRGSVATPAGPLEYLAVPVVTDDATQAVFLVGVFRDVVATEIDQTVGVTAAVALVALLAGIGISIGLARRILRPLDAVTRAAREITESDLSRRLDADGHDEIARLAQTFNAMLDRLERAFALQRDFVDDAGHELRTPITVIRGHLELLGDETDPAERAATIALVLDELDRMHRIVEDLLTLARSEQPDFVRPAPFDLDELTSAVHRKASAISDAHAWEIDHLGVGRVVGDQQRLTQALVQLADNGAAYAPAGTTITIGSEHTGSEVRLWVRDQGPGIPAAERERIFDRFSRGASGARRSDGAGMGLSIVRAIAHAHGGMVEVDSIVGEGTTFTLRLPARPDAPSEADGTPPRPPSQPAAPPPHGTATQPLPTTRDTVR